MAAAVETVDMETPVVVEVVVELLLALSPEFRVRLPLKLEREALEELAAQLLARVMVRMAQTALSGTPAEPRLTQQTEALGELEASTGLEEQGEVVALPALPLASQEEAALIVLVVVVVVPVASEVRGPLQAR